MSLIFGEVLEKDLPFMLGILADDEVCFQHAKTANTLNLTFLTVLKSILSDPNNGLIVVEKERKIRRMLILTFIPY